MADIQKYKPESVGSIMSDNVLTAKKTDTVSDILHLISKTSWDDIQYVYILEDRKLIGVVDSARTFGSDKSAPMLQLMVHPDPVLKPGLDQEKAVQAAIKHDSTAVPVVDKAGNFLGAITARTIIDVMHEEHIEDMLLGSGLSGHGSKMLMTATTESRGIIRARAPWLIFGTFAGLFLGLVSSLFEESLRNFVALAYFVPVIAYIADSVGTQTQAIVIRALAIMKLKIVPLLFREFVVGVSLGLILGTIGGVGAFFISESLQIGLVVGLSLLSASSIASVLGVAVPITIKTLGKDPALGSGPLATALQDVVSILIYFLFAVTLLN